MKNRKVLFSSSVEVVLDVQVVVSVNQDVVVAADSVDVRHDLAQPRQAQQLLVLDVEHAAADAVPHLLAHFRVFFVENERFGIVSAARAVIVVALILDRLADGTVHATLVAGSIDADVQQQNLQREHVLVRGRSVLIGWEARAAIFTFIVRLHTNEN